MDIQRGLFADAYQNFDIDGQPIIYVLQEIVGQEGFSALANELNKVGWVTILLQAPDIGFIPTFSPDVAIEEDVKTAVAKETDSSTKKQMLTASNVDRDISQSAVTTIDKQAFAEHEQQLVSHLQAAFEKSQEYPGFFLVISKGTSAAWLSKIYAEKTLDAPNAFVTISPFWPEKKSAPTSMDC